jgi:hypothetical protein
MLPSMAAKVSPRVQQLVAEAAELPHGELAVLIEAIQALPRRQESTDDRHAVIAARAARVHAGDVATLTMEEVERDLRRDLDF